MKRSETHKGELEVTDRPRASSRNGERAMRTTLTRGICWLLALLALALAADLALARTKSAGAAPKGKAAVRQPEVAVEFSLQPLGSKGEPSTGVVAGEDAVVQFKVNDPATHAPLKGLRPAAWMNLQKERIKDGVVQKPLDCKNMIRSFVQEGLGSRPDLDLNSFYILALNDQPSLSVIDPMMGVGSSKLITQVLLKSPGQDWALSGDQKRLYVSLPLTNLVAVVDTATWKVTSNIPVGERPTRIALQPDEQYLWVANDGTGGGERKGGASVIDTAKLKVAAEFPTGAGHHELAFTDDNRYAFVSNEQDGTVSILDVQKLARIKDLKTGSGPVSLAFSPLSKMLYVAHADGVIAAVDPQKQELSARIKTAPDLRVVRVSPDGRWVFAASGEDNKVYIADASTHRLVNAVEVGTGPEQISFTAAYAYIRSSGTQEISMIPLGAVAKGETLSVAHFPGGQAAPDKSSHPAVANAVVPAQEEGAVLVANPVDKTIYYYTEGMNAPMGNFQNYGSEPRAVRVLDRSLKETAPGVYSTAVRLPQSGVYDVALFLDNLRFHQCFLAQAAPNPDLKKRNQMPVQLEFLLREKEIRAQEPTRIQFTLTDPESKRGKDDLKDVMVQSLLAPGIWHKREVARPVGGGIYEVELNPPRPGIYYVYVECPSLGIRSGKLPYLILQAVGEGNPSEQGNTVKHP